MAETREQAEDRDGEIEVEACGEGYGRDQGEEFCGWDLEQVEHARTLSQSATISLRGETRCWA